MTQQSNPSTTAVTTFAMVAGGLLVVLILVYLVRGLVTVRSRQAELEVKLDTKVSNEFFKSVLSHERERHAQMVDERVYAAFGSAGGEDRVPRPASPGAGGADGAGGAGTCGADNGIGGVFHPASDPHAGMAALIVCDLMAASVMNPGWSAPPSDTCPVSPRVVDVTDELEAPTQQAWPDQAVQAQLAQQAQQAQQAQSAWSQVAPIETQQAQAAQAAQAPQVPQAQQDQQAQHEWPDQSDQMAHPDPFEDARRIAHEQQQAYQLEQQRAYAAHQIAQQYARIDNMNLATPEQLAAYNHSLHWQHEAARQAQQAQGAPEYTQYSQEAPSYPPEQYTQEAQQYTQEAQQYAPEQYPQEAHYPPEQFQEGAEYPQDPYQDPSHSTTATDPECADGSCDPTIPTEIPSGATSPPPGPIRRRARGARAK